MFKSKMIFNKDHFPGPFTDNIYDFFSNLITELTKNALKFNPPPPTQTPVTPFEGEEVF